MYSFPVSTLQPGMVLYDDLYTSNNTLLLKANTLLTEDKIQLLKDNSIDSVSLAEPMEINITHYQYLYNSEYQDTANNQDLPFLILHRLW